MPISHDELSTEDIFSHKDSPSKAEPHSKIVSDEFLQNKGTIREVVTFHDQNNNLPSESKTLTSRFAAPESGIMATMLPPTSVPQLSGFSASASASTSTSSPSSSRDKYSKVSTREEHTRERHGVVQILL